MIDNTKLKLEIVNWKEVETLCNTILATSHHYIERYNGEREQFISKSKNLAGIILDFLNDSKE